MKVKRKIEEARALFAELLGSFFLTFVAIASAVVVATHPETGNIVKTAAPGLIVMALVYSIGSVSGAHINPVITVAFALRRAFPWQRVPAYIVAQIIGAITAAISVRLLFGSAAYDASLLSHINTPQALGMEILLTMILVTIVIGTATGNKIVGSNAGIAVGGTISLCIMLGETVSGPSMNPALSLGQLLIAGNLSHYWIFVVGPLIGAALAVTFNYISHGKSTEHEQATANGTQSLR